MVGVGSAAAALAEKLRPLGRLSGRVWPQQWLRSCELYCGRTVTTSLLLRCALYWANTNVLPQALASILLFGPALALA